MATRTRVEYLYRDASNYKFYGDFTVDGELGKADLEPFLFDGEWFVPMAVGLPHLLNLPINEDDHLFHEITGFAPTDKGTPECSASDLIARFRKAHQFGWFSGLR